MVLNAINQTLNTSITMETDGICIGYAWHYSTGSDSMTINNISVSLGQYHEVKTGDIIAVKITTSGYTIFGQAYASIGGVIIGYSYP